MNGGCGELPALPAPPILVKWCMGQMCLTDACPLRPHCSEVTEEHNVGLSLGVRALIELEDYLVNEYVSFAQPAKAVQCVSSSATDEVRFFALVTGWGNGHVCGDVMPLRYNSGEEELIQRCPISKALMVFGVEMPENTEFAGQKVLPYCRARLVLKTVSSIMSCY